MPARSDALIPWRDRAFVSAAEAAAILGRSTTWIYDRVTSGPLEAFRLSPGGRVAISVPSILAMIDRACPVDVAEPPAAPRRRAHLTLVVSNS